MARCLTVLTPTLEIQLNDFMKKNKIKSKSKAIRMCVEMATSNISTDLTLLDISNKVNKLLYRTNMIKKLSEQEFANHGFPFNDSKEADKALKDFYASNDSSWNSMLD